MSAYGTSEERRAWAVYGEATARRRLWHVPSLLATGIVSALVVGICVAAASPWALLLTPLPLVPTAVWYLVTVRPENQAGKQWDQNMHGSDRR